MGATFFLKKSQTNALYIQEACDRFDYLEIMESKTMPYADDRMPLDYTSSSKRQCPDSQSQSCQGVAFGSARFHHRVAAATQSPDLNPTENLWTVADKEVKKQHPKSIAELEQACYDAWKKTFLFKFVNITSSP